MIQEIEKYKDVFICEATEHINQMNQSLLQLEKTPQEKNLIIEIFRQAHTLKSMAAIMGYENTANLCHAIENVLTGLKEDRIVLKDCVDLLFESFDVLDLILDAVQTNQKKIDIVGLANKLQQIVDPETKPTAPMSYKSLPGRKTLSFVKEQTINLRIEKLDILMRLIEELVANKLRFDIIKDELKSPKLFEAIEHLNRLVSDIQRYVMQLRLVPISFVFNRFPRMIRDLAKKQQKEINLYMEGADVELDRTIIDELGKSLAHLLNNAVDHGIETKEVRKKFNKPECATIKLIAAKDKNYVVVEVVDDGRGLDLEKIKIQAVKKGIINSGASEKEITNAIFSGISTTDQVTTVSGRGVGLNAVQDKINSLGGNIKVKSKVHQGTKFIIEVPLTRVVIRVLFVKVGDLTFAVPVANIDRLVTAYKADIKGRKDFESIIVDAEDIPIVRLSKLFNITNVDLNKQQIVIVSRYNEKLGLVVDSFASTQEIVIEPLDTLAKENHYFSGSTTISSGEVIFVLDVVNLILFNRQLN